VKLITGVTESAPQPDPGHWPPGTWLQMLTPGERAALLALGREEQYGNGHVVLREQDQSSHVVLLHNAIVKITGSVENGRTAFLGIKVSGNVVGEMAALRGRPRSATVTTCGNASVRVIPKESFLRYLRNFPDAHFALDDIIIAQLEWANKRRLDFNGYPAFIRLARILVELANGYGRHTTTGITFDFGLTQRELGALIGVEGDTARKELRKLRENGVIHARYGTINIVDKAKLEAIAYEQDQTGQVRYSSSK
jgi:CRP/FNR family transcriptional regulator, cyclic AMP receptor protein